MRSIFATILSCLFCLCYGQKGTFSGTLTDGETGEPLAFANVVFPGGTGTTTDMNGAYIFDVEAGSYRVDFSYIGYETRSEQVTIEAGKTTTFNIALTEIKSELNTVVVSASKFDQELAEVTVSMAIIRPTLIENKSTISCETILEQIPGVTVLDGQLSIRGGSGFAYGAGSRVMVMVDDVPFLAGDAGDARWNNLPVENVEQIEVIKGASSVLYGSSALNGVINLRTASPGLTPRTKINLFHGVYNDPQRSEIIWWDSNPYYAGGNFLHSRQIGNMDLTLTGNFLSDRGYRQGEEEHRGRITFNTRWRNQKVEGLSYGVGGNAQINHGGLFLIWMNDSNVYEPFGGLDPETTTISYYTNYRYNLDPYLTYFDKSENKHSIKTRWYNARNTNDSGQESDAHTWYGEYQFQWVMDSIQATLVSGITGTYNSVKSELYGDHNGSNLAVYTQFDKKFFGRLNLSAGFRVESFKLDTAKTVSSFNFGQGDLPFQPVFRAGLSYRLLEETFVRASWGQGYRFPSIAEKFVNTSVGALNIFPNAAVQPEYGWSAEVGIKQGFKFGNWVGYLDVAAFVQEYTDMMEFTFGVYNPDSINLVIGVPSNPNDITHWLGFRAENVEQARISGIDVGLTAKGSLGKVDVAMMGGYTYMNPISLTDDSTYRASLSDTTSTMLKYRYRHLIKGDIQFDYNKWSLGWSIRYTSAMENIDRTFMELWAPIGATFFNLGDYILPGLPDWRERFGGGGVVCDARLSYQFSKTSKMAIIVNNVFNREYDSRPGDVQPPRTVAAQFTLEF